MGWNRPDGPRGAAVRLGALVGVGTALAVLFFVDPNQAGHYPSCPFLRLTGWYCPGCGSLRATYALLHLRPREALARNPLAVAVVGWLPVRVALRLTGRLSGRPTPPAAIWSLLALVLAFWVLRNIPGAQWLQP